MTPLQCIDRKLALYNEVGELDQDDTAQHLMYETNPVLLD